VAHLLPISRRRRNYLSLVRLPLELHCLSRSRLDDDGDEPSRSSGKTRILDAPNSWFPWRRLASWRCFLMADLAPLRARCCRRRCRRRVRCRSLRPRLHSLAGLVIPCVATTEEQRGGHGADCGTSADYGSPRVTLVASWLVPVIASLVLHMGNNWCFTCWFWWFEGGAAACWQDLVDAEKRRIEELSWGQCPLVVISGGGSTLRWLINQCLFV
jgi:hypothetical protein